MIITGSEWIKQVKDLDHEEVMESALDQVDDGNHLIWPMIPITSGDITIYVASDVFAIGTPDDYVRVPLDGPTAQAVAERLDCMLPTSMISDLIWSKASYRAQPMPMGPPQYPYDSSMMSVERFADHSAWCDKVKSNLGAKPDQLIAGLKKDVVISNRLLEHPHRLAIYGWHRLDGTPIQGPYVSIRHIDTYYDYSHGIRMVSKSAKKGGVKMSLKDLLVDPVSCALLSKEGELKISYYGLPADDPDDPVKIPPTIRRGDKGHIVKLWQAVINVGTDGIFGPNTERETRSWQLSQGLVEDGIVGPLTWRMAKGIDKPAPVDPSDTNDIPFVKAKHFRKISGKPRDIDLVVLHTMEAVEHPRTAECVAAWFSRGCPDAKGRERRASAHYNIDEDSVVQSVNELDVAFTAPGSNHNGIHLEHAGYSHQRNDSAGWQDAYSQAMLARSAKITAAICKRHNIPVKLVRSEELLDGDRGITFHREVSFACGKAQRRGLTISPFYNHYSNRPKTDHTDPGKHFPIDQYLSMVNDEIARI